jgi:hypothetical protein
MSALLASSFWNQVSHWSLPEWLTVIGFPAVGFGLFLAWRHISEIQRAADAAERGAKAAQSAAEEARQAAVAAREATARTERKIADQNLLMLISQAQRLADDLDRAAAPADGMRLCSEWIGTASELQGILQAANADDSPVSEKSLVDLLQDSIEAAGQAKNAIIDLNQGVPVATTELRHQLIEVRAASSRILGRMRAYTGEQPYVR